jgi:uncharacterized protein with PQ loop repeat
MRVGKFEGILILSALLEINPFFQAAKMWQTKTAHDVSPWTFLMILSIGCLWFAYGVRMKSRPLMVANAIKLVASSTVLIVYAAIKW